LSYLVLIPAIKYFGSAGTLPDGAETAHSIVDMRSSKFRRAHSLHRRGSGRRCRHYQSFSLHPPHLAWIEGRARGLRGSGIVREDVPRTTRSLHEWVMGGIIALLIVIMIAPQLNLRFNLLGAVLIVALVSSL